MRNLIAFILIAIFLNACKKKDSPDNPGFVFPVISSISPSSGGYGTMITISGTGFNSIASGNSVPVNGVPAIITASSSTQLTIIIPAAAGTGPISVTTAGGTATGSTFTYNVSDIFVAGTIYNTAGDEKAAYWKNGVDVNLMSGSEIGEAQAITVSGNDIYVVGQSRLNANPRATLWKNGSPIYLTDGSRRGCAYDVQVVGNDVYVCGYEANTTGSEVAKYWKNGAAVTLGTGAGYSVANAILITGNDIYVAGDERYSLAISETTTAKYWKNGNTVNLSTGMPAETRDIFVTGNDVYVSGAQFAPPLGREVKYWKNGIANVLDYGAATYSAGTGIVVRGSNVYVSGVIGVDPLSSSKAVYWKNGIATTLAYNQFNGAEDISVINDDIYTCGYQSDGNNYWIAKLWKNGISLPLPSTGMYSMANGIYVR